jgi:hypothetical protein
MDRALRQKQRALHLQRRCERSRVESDLWTTAYELIVPEQRQSLPPPHSPTAQPGEDHRPVPRSKGVSA